MVFYYPLQIITRILVMIQTLEARHNCLALLGAEGAALLLLPRLLGLCEFTHGGHGEVAAFKLVGGETLALETRGRDSVQYKVVVRARKVQQAETVDATLVLWRNMHAVYGRAHIVAGEERERIARVDGEARVEGLGPLPLTGRVVLDLQTRDWLPEQERDCAEVRVALRVEPIARLELRVVFRREAAVLSLLARRRAQHVLTFM